MTFRASGNPDVLGSLYLATASALLPTARAITGDTGLAEDALHEAFVDLFQHAGRYDPSRPALPWLVGIVRRKALKIRRREQRRVKPQRLLRPTGSEPICSADEVAGAIDALDARHRSVARLRWLHGLTPQDIAILRDEPPGTTRSLLSRGVVKLQRLLENLAGLLVLTVALPRWLVRWPSRLHPGSGTVASAGGTTGAVSVVLAGALGLCAGWAAIGGVLDTVAAPPDHVSSAVNPSNRIHQARPATPEGPFTR